MPYKVAYAVNLDMGESRDAVHIHKASVEYGNGHALSCQTEFVQTVAVEHLDLLFPQSVSFLFDAVP